jgi:hypothetical protein
MLQFQTKQNTAINMKKGQKANFYAMAGVKTLLLFKNKFEAKVESLYNAAYYPEFDNWADTQIFAGLSTFDGNNVDGNFRLNILAMIAFETGVKWRIGKAVYLYTGACFDLGMNDPSKKIRKPFEHYIYEEHLSSLTLLKLADKMSLMNVGVKLRLAFFHVPNLTSCSYY